MEAFSKVSDVLVWIVSEFLMYGHVIGLTMCVCLPWNVIDTSSSVFLVRYFDLG
jgi:hypothetical protein